MLPKIFGVIDSYALMLLIGALAAIAVAIVYLKHIKKTAEYLLSFSLSGIIAILIGVIFACLFQNLYNFISNPSEYKFTLAMTFYGGLFGGVAAFLLMYFLYLKKKFGPSMKDILIIAPGAITLAHGFGRIGCFLSGCCYGKETNQWYGIYFPVLEKMVIPTQLFEAVFLFLLSAILLFLAFKKNYKYTMIIYLLLYSIWRFFLEFVRDDPRGAFLGVFSPSQIWCILLFIGAIPLAFLFKNVIFKETATDEKQ